MYYTGFGSSYTCILCKGIDFCKNCLYYKKHWWGAEDGCDKGKPKKTYMKIRNAKNSDALRKAMLKRAEFLEKLIVKIERRNP